MAAHERQFGPLSEEQNRAMLRELKQLIAEGVVVPQEPEPEPEVEIPEGEEAEKLRAEILKKYWGGA